MLVASLCVVEASMAQGFPSRPLRLVVGYAPGGPTDILGRALAPRLAEVLGQPVVIENRPGAASNIGTEAVVRSAPDGYTLLMGDMVLSVNPSLFKSLGFNPRTDLAPVGFVASSPLVLVVPPALEPKTAGEFVAFARARPGQLSYGSPGNGTPPHLATELFKSVHGLDIQQVAYKGAGPALADLVGARLQLMLVGISAAKPFVDSGKLRALAITGTRRAPGLPAVPTFAESGAPLTEMNLGAWWGVFVPAGTPREVLARLNEALGRALALPAARDQLAALNMEPAPGSPEQLAGFLAEETRKWAGVIERAKIRAD